MIVRSYGAQAVKLEVKRGRLIHTLSYRIEIRIHVWQLFQKYSAVSTPQTVSIPKLIHTQCNSRT